MKNETPETLSQFVLDLYAAQSVGHTSHSVLAAICQFASMVGRARDLVAFYGEYPGKLGNHSNHVA